MNPKKATTYLLWCGEKAEAGVDLTPAEFEMMKEARAVSIAMAHRFMRIKPQDYAYQKGKGFQEV